LLFCLYFTYFWILPKPLSFSSLHSLESLIFFRWQSYFKVLFLFLTNSFDFPQRLLLCNVLIRGLIGFRSSLFKSFSRVVFTLAFQTFPFGKFLGSKPRFPHFTIFFL
ncbi:hypothetical protein PanWU01x14_122230, partial [Parasponia andersonii]